MMMQSEKYKDKMWIVLNLDAAVEVEKDKYEKRPVNRDFVPEYEAVQGWGYVVAGYFLIEQSFKALLHVCGKSVPRTHSLTKLFGRLGDSHKELLREFYTDYLATDDKYVNFSFETLDEFLVNLDGGQSGKGGDNVGSLNWRYFLIENHGSGKMPLTSVELLHEIAYGGVLMVEHALGRIPTSHVYACTRSGRMSEERFKKHNEWLRSQMNSPGWETTKKNLTGKLVLLWGPDYRGRYDMFCLGVDEKYRAFRQITEDGSTPTLDKRKEAQDYQEWALSE